MSVSKPQEVPVRLQWIDQIKGIAILAIVLFHFFQNYPDQFGLVAALNRNGAKLGYAAVDIFFVMAGFNISFVMASRLGQVHWKSWLKKRLFRLYPTYLLAVICSLLLYTVLRGYKLQFDLKTVLSVLGLAGYSFQAINPGFWFFTVILEAYLFTPFIVLACRRQPTTYLILGAILGILTKLICLASSNSPYYLFFLQTNFLGSYIFQFCLGLYWGITYSANKSFSRKDWRVVCALFGLGLVSYVALSLKGIDIVYMLGFDLIFTPFMFMGLYRLLNLSAQIKVLQLALAFAALTGVYSYQIYLIHQPLLFSIFPYLAKYIPFSQPAKLIVSFITISGLLTLYVYVFTALEAGLRKRFDALIQRTQPTP
ncbi:MAG: acyltransferase [Myxacorys californica WJT36-NPBG1]|jgi:peptidoglycan/LPS O-acetylase OafA/YrhL|nr:acyltransferase [Myxacorys californica WJT36-NPBG1]